MYNINSISANMEDIRTGQRRSTTSMMESGGWIFKQVSQYTSVAPLTVSNGVKTKIVIPLNDAGFSDSNYFELSYDYVNGKFMPITQGDVYLLEFRCKIRSTQNDGNMDITLEIPGVSYNPISGDTKNFTKSIGEEQFITSQQTVFIGADAVNNGIELFVKPNSTGVEIYDYSFLIVRLFSNKNNTLI